MTPRKITGRLRKLGRRIDELTGGYTNRGGCCFVASIVADELAALGIPARGVVATFDGDDVDAARPSNSSEAHVWDWNENGLDFNHVGLEVDVGGAVPYLFDSEGTVRRDRAGGHLPAGMWPLIPGYLDADELRALTRDDDMWNDMFPRETIPAIRAETHRILSAA